MKKTRQELLNQASDNYSKLQFRDDFLFCKILGNNPEIARELLELILDVKIRKVVVEPQKPIEITAEGRGDSDLCNRIENEVIRAREHNEWRVEFMTLYMRDQENIEKGREEGRETQLKESIRRMIMTKRFTNKEIADLLGAPLDTVIAVEKELVVAKE